jgi:hypothetical protein
MVDSSCTLYPELAPRHCACIPNVPRPAHTSTTDDHEIPKRRQPLIPQYKHLKTSVITIFTGALNASTAYLTLYTEIYKEKGSQKHTAIKGSYYISSLLTT